MKKTAKLFRNKISSLRGKLNKSNKFVFILLFGLIGSFFLYRSFANSPNVNNTPSNDQQSLTIQLLQAVQVLQSNPSSQTAKNKVAELADKRKEATKLLIQTDPAQAARLELNGETRDKLPAAVQEKLEKTVILTGDLQLVHGEDIDPETLEPKNPVNYYTLKTDNREYNVHFPDKGPAHYSSRKVTIKGVVLDNVVGVPSSNDPNYITAEPSTVLAAVTNKNVAAIMVNFNNTDANWTTQEEVRNTLFTDLTHSPEYWGSVSDYYTENSHGRLGLTGEVYGPYTINYSASNCDYGNWSTAADAAATAAGVNLASFTNKQYILHSSAACGWAGLGQLPGSRTWVKWSGLSSTSSTNISRKVRNQKVSTHELGHNFGEHHSGSYGCKDASGATVTYSTNCSLYEYGDGADIMGNGQAGSFANYQSHSNIFQKGALGWIDPINTQTISTNATVALAPLELASTGVQSLRIPKDVSSTGAVTSYYYVEARSKFGYDGGTTNNAAAGIRILIAPNYQSGIIPGVLHTSVTGLTGNIVSQTMTTSGATYTDTTKNLAITYQGVDSGGKALVKVDYAPSCSQPDPTATITPLSQWKGPNYPATYTLSVTNNDGIGCSPSEFTALLKDTSNSSIFRSDVNGIKTNAYTDTFTLAPGATTSIPIYLNSNPTSAAGAYPFTETVTNKLSGRAILTPPANYNVDGTIAPKPDATTPLIAIIAPAANTVITAGTSTTITASASDNVNVIKYEIFVDGVLKHTHSYNPAYNFLWNSSYTWSTAGYATGSHTLAAKAYDAAGNVGSTSMVVSVGSGGTTPDTTAPSVPTGLNAQAAAYNRVNLTWTASTDNIGVTGYQIIRNGVTVAQTSGTGTSYVDSTVVAGTSYSYQVKAKDAAGNISGASNTATAITPTAPTAPAAPTGLVATAVSATQVNLNWSASSGSPATYDIYRNSVKVASVNATFTTFGESGLTASTTYNYYVVAVNAVGSSSPSATVSVTTLAPPPPPPPATTGSIQGTVSSSRGGTVSGAKVSIIFNGSKHTYLTNSSGFYNATAIPTGTYSVTFSAKQHQAQTLNVTIGSGIATTQNITLTGSGKR